MRGLRKWETALRFLSAGCLATLCLLLLAVQSGEAQGARGFAVARHKIGPVTLRGVVAGPTATHFTLRTKAHGDLRVVLTPATKYVHAGGTTRLATGEHVGVKGFLSGSTLRAMRVRVYPTKAKLYSRRGTVVGVSGSTITLKTSSQTTRFLVTSSTQIVGSSGASASLRRGDRVLVRLRSASPPVAVRVHVYRRHTVGRHVLLRGVVRDFLSSSLSLSSGVTVRVTSSTAVYVGLNRATARSLHSGESVTVHACCSGHALRATSVHILKIRTRASSVQVRGVVTVVAEKYFTLRSGRGTQTIIRTSSTVVQLGSATSSFRSLQRGDHVSVRGKKEGNKVVAARVHVYMSYRRPRTVRGVVTAVQNGRVQVTARGGSWTINIGTTTIVTLQGRRVSTRTIRVGEHLAAKGRLVGHMLAAAQVSLSRPKVPVTNAHGSVVTFNGSRLLIRDSLSRTRLFLLNVSTLVELHHSRLPRSRVLFAGAPVSIHARRSGSQFIALKIDVMLRTRTATGRVVSSRGRTVTLRVGSRNQQLSIPPGVQVTDNGKLVRLSLSQGVFLAASAYVVPGKPLHVLSAKVLHPLIEASGNIVKVDPDLALQSVRYGTFHLKLDASARLSSQPGNLSLRLSDVPTQARAHVSGVAQSDGRLLVNTLRVHLSAFTARGKVTNIGSGGLVVDTGGTPIDARLAPSGAITQGSRTMSVKELVIGDDVTVDGYRIRSGSLLARKVALHRRLVGLDGTVATLNGSGFVLIAADGSHKVIVPSGVLFSNGTSANIVVGLSVHVTGYRRGDGSILATRLRFKKKKRS